MGAGSLGELFPFKSCSAVGEVITGRIVDKDSGRRRVRKSVEACRYILEIWEEPCRGEDVALEMEEESNCDELELIVVVREGAIFPVPMPDYPVFADEEEGSQEFGSRQGGSGGFREECCWR